MASVRWRPVAIENKVVIMSQAKDTLLRLFALLRLIPIEPQRIATPPLLEKFRDKGFFVTLRSIQRDLSRPSTPFSRQRDNSEMPFRWSFTREALLKLEDMPAPTALALLLSESHLNPALLQRVPDQSAPQFCQARNFLSELRRQRAGGFGEAGSYAAPIEEPCCRHQSARTPERRCPAGQNTGCGVDL